MGQEARCVARRGAETCEGKALLETEELIFRGEFRTVLRFEELSEVTESDGWLRLRTAAETLELHLGPQAEKWAHRMLNPRSLLEKLGVKPGHRVSTVRVADRGFLDQLRQQTPDLHEGAAARDSDWIFLWVDDAGELGQLRGLRDYLKPAGGIWVISPRGRRDLQEGQVYAAARDAGLVDTKVARFSDTHTANKLVIPLSQRGAVRR